jgi:hypothetical protein
VQIVFRGQKYSHLGFSDTQTLRVIDYLPFITTKNLQGSLDTGADEIKSIECDGSGVWRVLPVDGRLAASRAMAPTKS